MIRLHSPKLNRTSEAYMRMSCAGFKIGEPFLREVGIGYEKDWPKTGEHYQPGDIFIDEPMAYIRCIVPFQCVCGRDEYLVYSHQAHVMNVVHKPGNLYDACRDIEREGAVSVEHLQKDGFSAEEISRIRYVYDLHDRLRDARLLRDISFGYQPYRPFGLDYSVAA